MWGAAVGVAVALVLAVTGCSAQSEWDQYSYGTIQDDELAQRVYLVDQGYLVDGEALAAQGAELESWVALQTERSVTRFRAVRPLTNSFSSSRGRSVTS